MNLPTIILCSVLLVLLIVTHFLTTGSDKKATEMEEKPADSFYVEEDGTIVRGKRSEATESHTSVIIHEANEQKEALSLIHESAEAGIAEAQYYLGLCYEQGTVVDKDLDMAKKWYRLAAAQSYPLAKFRLGKIMLEDES